MEGKGPQRKEDVEEIIKSENVELVRVQCEDICGVSRGFTLDVDYFLRCIEDGIPIPKGIQAFRPDKVALMAGTGVYEEVGYGNCAMYPDVSTFRVLPWEKNVATILSTLREDCNNPYSQLFPISSRNLCTLQLEKLKTQGIQLYSAFEYEFYVLSKDDKNLVTKDESVFSTISQLRFLPFVKETMKSIKAMGIHPEVHHNECGPGQQEITMSPEFGLESPDNAFRFKHATKEIALKHNFITTFMSMPFMNEAGSSGHFNHSLWDNHGNCIMYDATKTHGFSEVAENWLAGLLHHSDALMCLAAPFSNCYERINPDMNFAPFKKNWGCDDRTVAFRIKNEGTPKLYIESRLSGGAVNPYLLVAGIIIAGMDGIKNKFKLDPKWEGDSACETLPTTLDKSLECLQRNEVFIKEIGPEFLKCYVTTRQEEYETAEEIRASKGCEGLFKWYRECYAEFI